MTKKKKNNKKESHEAMRTCIACRSKKPKRELVRFVLDGEGKPVVDVGGKMSGRGANLCASVECFDRAVEKGSFNRAWKVSVPRDEWDRVRKDLEKDIASREFRGGRKSVTVRVRKEKAEEIIGTTVTRKPEGNE